MKHSDVRGKLIDNTISVIAEEGLDKTTTKAIVSGTDINESYIYRFFADKEDLLAKTFDALDNELVAKVMFHISIMYMRDMEYEIRCRFFFMSIWKFLLDNRKKCIAYIRYYYSPYFQKYSATAHKERCVPLVEKFEDAFGAGANVWMLLDHILNVMLDVAVKVFDGTVQDNDDTAQYVFGLVYHSIQPHFKPSHSVKEIKEG